MDKASLKLYIIGALVFIGLIVGSKFYETVGAGERGVMLTFSAVGEGPESILGC